MRRMRSDERQPQVDPLAQRLFQFFILITVLIISALSASGCRFGRSEPELKWDPSPQAVLIKASDPIQFPGISPTWQDERMDNYIPEGVVFGDGRVQWVEYVYGGEVTSRRVLEGYLTPEQTHDLLRRFVDSGFFSWKDQYSGPFQEDGPPSQVLAVYLRDQTKQVVVNNTQPPQGFRELAQLISSGAGASGQEYMPKLAFLSAFPQFIEWNEEQGIQVIRWPAVEAGFTLADLADVGGAYPGKYVEWQVLAFAWQVINASPHSPLVEDGGEIYLITLQIPGLSMYNLPDP